MINSIAMRKLSLFSVVVIFCSSIYSQTNSKDTILLFHPTKSNISTIEYLLKEKVLLIANCHFKGIYHSNETYNYSESYKYLEDHPGLPFSLSGIDISLDEDKLFINNDCTPEFMNLFSNTCGSIFLGGPDIPPGIYNESSLLLSSVTDPGRHYLELSYLFHLLGGSQNEDFIPFMKNNPNYGVLGICLGMQSINVATGGTMIQDIPSEVYGFSIVEEILASPSDMIHSNYYMRDPACEKEYTSYHFHRIEWTASENSSGKNKTLVKNSNPFVLSSHHQAIESLGKGLTVIANSIDGKIVEAIIHREYKNVLGVQFHPEKTGLYDSRQEFMVNSDSSICFNTFVIENASLSFHRDFWIRASDIFKY